MTRAYVDSHVPRAGPLLACMTDCYDVLYSTVRSNSAIRVIRRVIRPGPGPRYTVGEFLVHLVGGFCADPLKEFLCYQL